MSEHEILIGLTLIVVLAVGGQSLGARLGIPAILVLLIFGMIAGPFTGLLNPDELLGDLLFPLVSLSVGIILFEGGLLLRFGDLTGAVGGVVRRLLTVGVLVTWGGAVLAGVLILDLEPSVAAVLGALLTVSGPTVVLPLLTFIRPSEDVETTLKWEGIFVDAIGAALAVLVLQAVLAGNGAPGPVSAAVAVFGTLLVGGLVGGVFAGLLIASLRIRDFTPAMESAVTLALVVAAFTVGDTLRAESGLFATTLMGVVLANQPWIDTRRIHEFKESIGLLASSVLFIVLSARLETEELTDVLVSSLLFATALILIVRPAAVWLSTIRSGTPTAERLMLAWMAPRGIVAAATASAFGFEMAEEGIAGAEVLGPVTFLVILITVAVYGLTGVPVARALGVSQPPDGAESSPAEADDVDLPSGR